MGVMLGSGSKLRHLLLGPLLAMLITPAFLQGAFGTSYEYIDLEEIAFTEANGDPLTEIIAGRQTILSLTFHSYMSEDTSFLGIVEVRDVNGFTEYLSWQSNVARPDSETKMGFSWLPEKAGCFEARSFAVTELENPNVLSLVDTQEFDVVDTTEPITGQFQLTQLGNALIFVPDEDDPESGKYGQSDYIVSTDISGTFEFRLNCHLDLIANNATLTVKKAGGEIVSTHTYKPTFTVDKYLSGLGFRMTGANIDYDVTGNAGFQYPLTSARFDRVESIRITGGNMGFGNLMVENAPGKIQFIPDTKYLA